MPRSESFISIDGAYGEGGGATVRTALTMAAMTQQGVRISHVRQGTDYPGVDVEDLTLLRTLADLCDAETMSTELGHDTIMFLPKRAPRSMNGRVRTLRNERGRGSNAPILLSTLTPILARAGALSEIQVEGETYANGSLSFDYLASVVGPVHQAMNLYSFAQVERAAYNREQEGLISASIEPSSFIGLRWIERGRPLNLFATVASSKLAGSIRNRAVSHLERLAQSVKLPIEVETTEMPSDQPGIYVTVSAMYEKGVVGGGRIGSKGLRAENVAQAAFDQCFDWMAHEAPLDPFAAEHVLVPASFAESPSEFRVAELSSRFMTAVWVIKQFAPIRITIKGTQGGPGHVTISR